ncbi:CCR4-NOT core subunit cdc39 [Friedmanniomyces endolithicus]|nr:CCR4-NOT core subunit cdc39 [Friedmanniomyces endolithicus]
MTLRPSSAHQEPPLTDTVTPTPTGGRGTRSQQSPWPGTTTRQTPRSGLAPISTGSIGHTRPGNSSDSPLRSTFSPTTSAFNHPGSSASRQAYSRQSSTSSAHSLTSPSAPGFHATGTHHSGQRSRPVTGTGSPRLASSLASLPSLSQGVGGGAGGGSGSSRLARHSPSLSASTVGSPVSSIGGGSAGHLSSLVNTQLNILLSTIKENNFDIQVEKIGKLLNENGMELFEAYFRRLLNSSWPHIFPHTPRPGTGPANAESYRLLESEVLKTSSEPQQAEKIATALDSGDFDLDIAAFADHFSLDPVAKTALVLACRSVANTALRSRADTALTDSWQPFFSALITPPPNQAGSAQDDVSPEVLATIIERLSQDPPRDFGERQKEDLVYAIKMRYQKLGSRMPAAVDSSLYLTSLLELPDSRLARTVQRAGPRGTASLDACKDMLSGVETRDISYPQIANALLFMVIAQNGDAYDAGMFVEGLRQHKAGPKIDWTDVVQGFDKDGLRVTKKQFLGLYNALVPLAREYANYDIQTLWGGPWQFPATQLSFVTAFLSTTPEELDVTQIPKLRQAFSLADYEDAPESIKAYAVEAVRQPLVSRDATEALFVMIFRSQEAYNDAQLLGIPETIINPNMTVFICAASAVPKPWAPLQEQALKQLFYPFLMKQHPNYEFAMHSLWMHDRSWVAQRLVEQYQTAPATLPLIYDHAEEHGWLELLLTIQSSFGVDLAAYANSKGRCDLTEWAQPIIQSLGPMDFARVLLDFIRLKVEDESHVQKQGLPRNSMPLALKTLHTMLLMMVDLLTEDDLGPIYRQCLQAYPRLFNYGEDDSRDAILEANCARGHAVPEEADAEMQERYKKMYGGESTPDDIVKELNELKVSADPAKQELFAAMLQGLFDEYNCFGEYPNEALATTAVLFGGLVLYKVLSGIAEQAAIYMVIESVSEYGTDDSMYRFGLQALIHMLARLKEWPHLAERILHIDSLQDTQAFPAAQAVLKELQQETVGLNGDVVNGITNGSLDDEFPVDSPTPPFSAIRADPLLRPDIYEEPNEDVSDRVMFALNNVSVRNLEEKFKDLETLEERHHQWFARYLVEELAKSQPNFQTLYLQLLDTFDRRVLWAEVLRETYVSCAKMLNAPSTMEQSSERASMKNLAGWLGALTLARNQPILHRNLSFKDLLIEGHNTQRLLVAIPFTCKALWHTRGSKVFRPPNPWIVELLGLLSELYHHGDLKINLKFEIEVLCRDLGLDIKTVVPLEIIRAGRPLPENNLLQPYVADGGPDGFGDMHLMGLSKRPPNERFSPDAVIQALPDLAGVLQIPQAAGNVTQAQLRQIFVTAAQQAIYEIIAPVVERSVTIAAISTAELIQKDFATEADFEKLRNSAYRVVMALSGSLALVTCKEPLRMSITNNIRIFAGRLLQDQLPEGQILMFVNDNIETVCGLVESAAEDHSLAEIDAQLVPAMEERTRHNELRVNEPFNNPPVSRWAQLIPEPFRQDPQGANASGLNRSQLGLYEDFGRQARITPTAHANSISQDSRGQLPDVLGDGFLPRMPTPAETPALPRPTPQQQRLQIQAPPGQHQVNGYMDVNSLWQRSMDLMDELQQASREAPEEHVSEIGAQDHPIRRIYEQLIHVIESAVQKDSLAITACERCFSVIYGELQNRLEIEVMVRLLGQLCRLSAAAGHRLPMYLAATDDEKLFNATATVALLTEGLLDLQHVDLQSAKALQARRRSVIPFLRDMLDEVLLGENAIAMRADFILTYDALGQWLASDSPSEDLREVMVKLQIPTRQTNSMPSPPQHDKRNQSEYIFEEWVRLQRRDTPEHSYLAFVRQLYEANIISESEEAIGFWRASLEAACAAFERVTSTPYGTQDASYVHIDALAKLIAFVATYQSLDDVDMPAPPIGIKMLNAIMKLVLMVMNQQQVKLRERWITRVFFRFFSSLLCELHDLRAQLDAQQEQQIAQAFATALMILQPRHYVGFMYPWLGLVSHRLLVPKFLNVAGRNNGGWETYTKLLCTVFVNLNILFRSDTSPMVQDYYRGLNRFLLMLHHDFPEFLIENHFQLNSAIPQGCVQLHNLINSAVPRLVEQPDPFTQGLKINRLDQVRQAPVVAGDVDRVLLDAGIKDAVDRASIGHDIRNEDYANIAAAVAPAHGSVNPLVAEALVLNIGIHATSASSVFSSAAPPARLLEHLLLRESRPAARHQIAIAMVNQVRYINAHTHYFSTALQHMITIASEEVQEQILLVVEERLMAPRPHPWGLIVMMIELIKNPAVNVWERESTKAAPQIQQMLAGLVHGQDPSGRLGRGSVGGMM